MPDLDILVEMADYYDVDLRELLDGERKSEKMNKDLEETVLKVADYSNDEKTAYFLLDWRIVFYSFYNSGGHGSGRERSRGKYCVTLCRYIFRNAYHSCDLYKQIYLKDQIV